MRSWREKKIKLRQRCSTHDSYNFDCAEGEQDQMLHHLSAEMNKTRQELTQLLAELQKY